MTIVFPNSRSSELTRAQLVLFCTHCTITEPSEALIRSIERNINALSEAGVKIIPYITLLEIIQTCTASAPLALTIYLRHAPTCNPPYMLKTIFEQAGTSSKESVISFVGLKPYVLHCLGRSQWNSLCNQCYTTIMELIMHLHNVHRGRFRQVAIFD